MSTMARRMWRAGQSSGGAGGGLRLSVSGNGRYFQNQSGEPFLVVADTCWTLMVGVSLADAKQYIDIRSSQGYNAILTNIVAFSRTQSGPRGTAFIGGDITQWNSSYFDGIDEIVAHAASKGVIIFLNGIWMADNGGWAGGSAPSNGDMATFGTMVGNRYKNVDNIVYFIGGDEQADEVWNPIKAYADALEAADPAHIKTYHPRWDSYAQTSGETWLDFNAFQRNDNTSPYLNQETQAGYALSPTRPIFCIEPPYDPNTAIGGIDTTPALNRDNVWGTALAGALGIAYGGPIETWNIGNSTGGVIDTNALDRTAAYETGYAGQILSQYNWQLLVPNNALVTGNQGSGRSQIYTAAAPNGSLIVSYVPTQRTFTLNASGLRTTGTARWHDPTTGTQMGGTQSVTAASGQSITSPGGGDSVLVITA